MRKAFVEQSNFATIGQPVLDTEGCSDDADQQLATTSLEQAPYVLLAMDQPLVAGQFYIRTTARVIEVHRSVDGNVEPIVTLSAERNPSAVYLHLLELADVVSACGGEPLSFVVVKFFGRADKKSMRLAMWTDGSKAASLQKGVDPSSSEPISEIERMVHDCCARVEARVMASLVLTNRRIDDLNGQLHQLRDLVLPRQAAPNVSAPPT